jgi:hypothetical protein
MKDMEDMQRKNSNLWITHYQIFARYGTALVIGVILFVAFAMVASAQSGTIFSLAPGGKAEYRFNYTGDGSNIKVGLSAPGATDVALSIYTPAQLIAISRGETPQPIGRGTPSKEYESVWTGNFRESGIYRIVIENRAIFPIQYRLDVSGSAVSSIAQIGVTIPQSSNSMAYDRGQSVLNVNFPQNVGLDPLRLTVPARPAICTPASKMPPTITQSTKLCSGEVYAPLKIAGSNIALFVDENRTAVVTSSGRQFALTVEGSNNWIDGLVISARADPQDLNAWLCLYDECLFQTKTGVVPLHGGIRYGGGILLKGTTNTTVRGVSVRGGTIGIASIDGHDNKFLDNELNDLNGWGSFNVNSTGAYFVNNQLHRNNHGCTTPDGVKYLHGCETAGWVCLGCNLNIIVSNKCELSANCYYMNGDRGLASNGNRFVANYCGGASDNCFEITFSRDNLLRGNISTLDPKTNTPCQYPFWVGGSVINFQANRWECKVNDADAFNKSRDSTVVGTMITNLDAFGQTPIPTWPRVGPTESANSSPATARENGPEPMMFRFPRGDLLEFVE